MDQCYHKEAVQGSITAAESPVLGGLHDVPPSPSSDRCTLLLEGTNTCIYTYSSFLYLHILQIITYFQKPEKMFGDLCLEKMCVETHFLFPYPEPEDDGDKSQMQYHIKPGYLYEIDHTHLPPRTPVQLRSIRVAMVRKFHVKNPCSI